MAWLRAEISMPSRPDVIDVPANSAPTMAEAGSAGRAWRSHAQLLWMSPVRTIGLDAFPVPKKSSTACASAW